MENLTLIFVYNADAGLLNTVTDAVHKVLSPRTYQCNLCALTHSPVKMRQRWKSFLTQLAANVKFLHRDELQDQHGLHGINLPAVLLQQGHHKPQPWSHAQSINACDSLDKLEALIRNGLKQAKTPR